MKERARLLTPILGLIFAAPLIAAQPATPPSPRSVSTLYCNNIAHAYVDAGEGAWLEKATLSNDTFTGWFVLGISRDALRRVPNLSLELDWPMAYQLDTAEVTAVHPMIKSTSITMVLTFPHLPVGAHHLRVGLLDTEGNLDQSQSYCFSTPGNAEFIVPRDH